jgi:hypothetical protein
LVQALAEEVGNCTLDWHYKEVVDSTMRRIVPGRVRVAEETLRRHAKTGYGAARALFSWMGLLSYLA